MFTLKPLIFPIVASGIGLDHLEASVGQYDVELLNN